MALSGSFSGSQRNGYEVVRLDWTATQNIANNTSTITCKLYFTNKYSISIGARTHTIVINGTSHTLNSGTITTTGEHYIGSVSQTVTHNSDGTKSIPLSFVFKLQATLSGTYYESISASATASLNTIARASKPSVSVSSLTLGSTTGVTISTNRPSTSFTHTLTWKIGSSTGTIATGVGASYLWKPAVSFASYITLNPSAVCTITCTTYNGSTSIGSESCTMTLIVPSTIIPSVSGTVTDATGNLTKYGNYVKGKSTFTVKLTGTGSYGSTIKSYKTVMNGTTYSTQTSTSGVLVTPGVNNIEISATDSRSRTGKNTIPITVLDYSPPQISSFSAFRCNPSGTEDANGTHIRAEFQSSITPLNNKNSKTFKIEYKVTTDTTWTTAATYNSDYSYNTWKVFSASGDNSYDVRIVATDDFTISNPITSNAKVGTVAVTMDFLASGNGIGVGKVAETEGLLDCNWDVGIEDNKALRFPTYGGGWYMSDSSWIRAYGNRGIYTSGTVRGGTVQTTSGANLDTVSNNTKWRTAKMTPYGIYGYYYNNVYSAKYRYDDQVLEVCVRGTFVTNRTMPDGGAMCLIGGLDVPIPSGTGNAMMWDDSGQKWLRITLNAGGYVVLNNNESVGSGHWLSSLTLNFIMFR